MAKLAISSLASALTHEFLLNTQTTGANGLLQNLQKDVLVRISLPRADRRRAIHSCVSPVDTPRCCSLPCCGSEGVPVGETASWLTACRFESYWSSGRSLLSEAVPVKWAGASLCLLPMKILGKRSLCRDTLSCDLCLPLETTLWIQTFLLIWLLSVVFTK